MHVLINLPNCELSSIQAKARQFGDYTAARVKNPWPRAAWERGEKGIGNQTFMIRLYFRIRKPLADVIRPMAKGRFNTEAAGHQRWNLVPKPEWTR